MSRPKAGPHWTMYRDFMTQTRRLTDKEFRTLCQVICDYAAGQEANEEAMSDRLFYAWEFFKPTLERQLYKQQVDRENGEGGGRTAVNKTEYSEPNHTQSYPIIPNDTQMNPSKPTTTTTNPVTNSVTNSITTTTAGVVVEGREKLTGMDADAIKALQSYCDKLPAEIVSHAISEATERGKPTWAYTRAILSRYIQDGITTLSDALASDGLKSPQKKNPATNYTQRTYSANDSLDSLEASLYEDAEQ